MDVNGFLNAQFVPREKSIEVPELKEFFGDDDPVWVVRSVTAKELAKAKAAASDQVRQVRQALITALSEEGDVDSKAQAMKDAMGEGVSTPTEMAVRLDLIPMATVSPDLGSNARAVVVKLSEAYPVVFEKIANAVYNLTGEGQELGKPKRSGKTKKSKP